MRGKPDWKIALGIVALAGLSATSCGGDRGRSEELRAQIAKLEAKVAEGEKVFAALDKGRPNVLTVSFEEATFNLSLVPKVRPGQGLKVVVNWTPNPDGWESVSLHDFRNLDGDPVTTDPPLLSLTPDPGNSEGTLKLVSGKKGPWVRYRISFTRTVGGKPQTWTVDPEWEHWP